MTANEDHRHQGGDDEAAALLEEAYKAARRGRIEELDLHLARLRSAATSQVKDLGDELTEIARCVRNHPSYRPSAAEREAI